MFIGVRDLGHRTVSVNNLTNNFLAEFLSKLNLGYCTFFLWMHYEDKKEPMGSDAI